MRQPAPTFCALLLHCSTFTAGHALFWLYHCIYYCIIPSKLFHQVAKPLWQCMVRVREPSGYQYAGRKQRINTDGYGINKPLIIIVSIFPFFGV